MSQVLSNQLEAIASGDTSQMAAFYEQWFDWILERAQKLLQRDEALSLDIVQEVMLKVIRKTPHCRTDDELRHWLQRVILTTSYDLLRNESRRSRRQTRSAQQATTASTESPSTDMDRHERLTWLRSELAALDPTSLWLLDARHRLGWTLARIGQSLGAKPGAIDRKLRTLTDELKAKGQEVFDD